MQNVLLALALLLTAPQEEPTELDRVLEFALEFQEWVLFGEVEEAKAAFDVEAALQDALGDREVNAEFREGFLDGADLGIVDQWASACAEGGTFDILRVSAEPERMVRMRYVDEEGFNYYELYLGPGEPPKIVDYLDYSTGERLTEGIERVIEPLFQGGKGTPNRQQMLALKQMEQIAKLVEKGRFERALRAFERLPESMRMERAVGALKVNVASQVGDEPYAQALAEFVELHGEDPLASLILIDHYVFTESWKEAHACVERLDAAVDDPYLDFIRGNLYALAGQDERVRPLYVAVVEAEPELQDPLWALVALDLEAENFEGVARWLLCLEFDVGLIIEVAGEEFYASFEGSQAFAPYLEERARRQELWDEEFGGSDDE